jgi:hypothetical protein
MGIKLFNEKRIVSSINNAGRLDILTQNNELGPLQHIQKLTQYG